MQTLGEKFGKILANVKTSVQKVDPYPTHQDEKNTSDKADVKCSSKEVSLAKKVLD
jgi:RecA/RadA recombinase